METTKTDELLKSFFNEHKMDIADNGFSQRVMRTLPEPRDLSWIMWFFTAMGIAVSMYLGFRFGLIESIMLYLQHISIYYLLAGVFSFPLISGVFIWQRIKEYSFI